MERDIRVFRGGQLVKTVRRPIHQVAGNEEVVYKGRRHVVVDGDTIHVDRQPELRVAVRQTRSRARTESTPPRSNLPPPVPDEGGRALGPNLDWTDEQRVVVEAASRARLLVAAGPGTGKTAVACGRVAFLAQQLGDASNIWLISFTRTAVQEIRNRIEGMCKAAADVRITTIDSYAWQLRQGFEDRSQLRLFGGYDQGIEATISMFKRPTEDLKEYLGSLEHVLIDEAQDVVGLRRQLLLQVIASLPAACGVTVLHDAAQAIYGFSEDEVSTVEWGPPLAEALAVDPSAGFQRRLLSHVQRTSDPRLRRLFTDVRASVEAGGATVVEDVKAGIRGLAHHTFTSHLKGDELAGRDDTLVLFRRRGEVLFSVPWLLAEGIPVRVRMSGLATSVLSAFGRLLWDFTEDHLSHAKWVDLCSVRLPDPACGEGIWRAMLRHAGKSAETLSVRRLRSVLARAYPPPEFVSPELGTAGPIFGTIHASKGREADVTCLMLPEGDQPEDADLEEEARVLFVGATRSRRHLSCGRSSISKLYKLNEGRVYRIAKGGAQVEIGRAGDLAELEQVSRLGGRDRSSVEAAQAILRESIGPDPQACHAVTGPAPGYTRELFDNQDRWIGNLASSLSSDLMKISHIPSAQWGASKFRPSGRINNIFVLGSRTVAIAPASPTLASFHEPFASSGFFLVPVLFGFPKVSFFKYGGKQG